MSKRILFLANHFITLYSFRKELIRRFIEDGHEVYLSLPDDPENSYFEQLGCKIVKTQIDRRGMNPLKDLKLLRFYKKMIPQVDPDIVFSYTIKPNIYGTLATNGKYRQVCNVTGTGATFLKKSAVGEICKMLYRRSVRKCYKVFFQNTGDRDFFVKNRMVADNYDMLPGSGCNLDEHPYTPMPQEDTVRFLFVGRVMKVKGIEEYIQAAKRIKSRYANTEFLIAGWNEEDVYKDVLEDYQRRGIVRYIGFRKDIRQWIERCHCTVLPSHGGEGVPNVLLESAATGRPCIASRISGSTDAVEDGVTGFLFDTGSVEDLVRQIERFMALTPAQKTAMGKAGREKIEREFDRRIVIERYLEEANKA